jgi:hypothetical protein
MNYKDMTQNIINKQDRVSRLEYNLREAQAELRDAEKTLTDAMIRGDVPEEFTAHGVGWKLDTTTRIRPVKEYSQKVVDWIEQNGGADLVQPSMHWARRDAFLREAMINENSEVVIPDELAGMIQVDIHPRVKRS